MWVCQVKQSSAYTFAKGLASIPNTKPCALFNSQTLVGQHLVARAALVRAGVVQELLQLLGGPLASRRVKFDCILLLSDLLESAIASDAAEAARLAHFSSLMTL